MSQTMRSAGTRGRAFKTIHAIHISRRCADPADRAAVHEDTVPASRKGVDGGKAAFGASGIAGHGREGASGASKTARFGGQDPSEPPETLLTVVRYLSVLLKVSLTVIGYLSKLPGQHLTVFRTSRSFPKCWSRW